MVGCLLFFKNFPSLEEHQPLLLFLTRTQGTIGPLEHGSCMDHIVLYCHGVLTLGITDPHFNVVCALQQTLIQAAHMVPLFLLNLQHMKIGIIIPEI